MTAPIDDMLDDVFGDDNELAVSVRYTPAGGTPKTVNGLFSAPYRAESIDTVGLESSAPIVTLRASDVVGVTHGDGLRISGTDYTVAGIHPDGQGLITLVLQWS